MSVRHKTERFYFLMPTSGCQQSDSEQDIIGNVNGVPADVFDGFSYVALVTASSSKRRENIQYSEASSNTPLPK